MVLIFSLLASHLFAKEITVCPTCQFKNIQQAINAANRGDELKIKSGTYFEYKIIIDKSISLTGENFPVVDLQKKGEGFIITANNVKLNGFLIRNCAVSSRNDFAGILVERCSNVSVTNNLLQNTFFGIKFSDSKNGLIANNTVIGENESQSQSGNGIQLWQCYGIKIIGNTIKKHRDGIYFEFANYCSIENNLSEENLRYGLHFMNSNHDSYLKNIFRNNGTGVAVMYSHHIYMMYNTFDYNRGDASYALLLKTISYGIICGNKFKNNTTGILMDETNAMKISRNVFEKNGWAVKLLSNCMLDTFSKNNFIANTFDVSTNGTLYNNYFKNNYWDKYEGYDLNRDDLGDVPYRPVSMYSVILEQIPQAGVLMRSIMVDLMDKVEKIIPSLIPELLKDVEPVMKQNRI